MLADKISNQAIYITVTGIEGSFNAINHAMFLFLKSTQDLSRGRISLNQLNKQNLQLKDIPIYSKDLRGIEKELKKYGVDYAIKQDLSRNETYKIFFKAKDISSIELALRNYTSKNYSKDKKPRLKDTILKYTDLSNEVNKTDKDQNLAQTVEGR